MDYGTPHNKSFDYNAETYASYYLTISDVARKHHGQLRNLTATTLDPLGKPRVQSQIFFEEPKNYNCYRFAIRSELGPKNLTLSTALIYGLLAPEIAAIKPRISYYFKEDEDDKALILIETSSVNNCAIIESAKPPMDRLKSTRH
jgi:hypothetical protein